MKGNKRAQSIMGLPFGLIFSIILIVVFIVFAFIAVKHFLSIGDCTSVGQFYTDFQKKINEAWTSQISSFEYKIDLPSGVKKICFANLSESVKGANAKEDYDEIERFSVYEANTFIVPVGKACDMPYKLINHINLEEITKTRNPYCISVSQKVQIKKDIYDKFVLIE